MYPDLISALLYCTYEEYINHHWSFCFCALQSKHTQEGAGEAEFKKFDDIGYDSDLVHVLERDIMSRNPNTHW